MIVDKQSDYYKFFIDNRKGWVEAIIHLNGYGGESWNEVDRAYSDTIKRKIDIIAEYSNKVKKVSFVKSPLISLKQFIDINNWFNKALAKEVNLLDNTLMDKLGGNPIYAQAEFKKIVIK